MIEAPHQLNAVEFDCKNSVAPAGKSSTATITITRRPNRCCAGEVARQGCRQAIQAPTSATCTTRSSIAVMATLPSGD